MTLALSDGRDCVVAGQGRQERAGSLAFDPDLDRRRLQVAQRLLKPLISRDVRRCLGLAAGDCPEGGSARSTGLQGNAQPKRTVGRGTTTLLGPDVTLWMQIQLAAVAALPGPIRRTQASSARYRLPLRAGASIRPRSDERRAHLGLGRPGR
jgi:hypothetical protein